MKRQHVQCLNCGQISSEIIGESEFKSAVRITKILQSRQTPHKKKIALFKWAKNLDVGSLQPEENQRIDALLLGKLYNELAKQSMKEYKKITADNFSREK